MNKYRLSITISGEDESETIPCCDLEGSSLDEVAERVRNDIENGSEYLKENIDEIKEAYRKCNDLFDEAFFITQCDGCNELPFIRKITTYMPDVMQTLSAIIDELEQ